MTDTDTDTTAQAWLWVLQHSALIEGTARKLGNGSGVDVEDLHSELLLRIVRVWPKYDNARSAPSTWVWWQARAAKKEMVKARARRLYEEPLPDDGEHALRVQLPAAEATVLLGELRELATPDEWDALLARAHGYEGAELRERCGCAPFSARRRVARLLARTV